VLDVAESQNIVYAGRNSCIDLANDRGLIRRLSSCRGNSRRDQEQKGDYCM
jgi:hypothetical protein